MVTQLGNDDIMIKITQPSHLANQTQCILSCYQGASGTRKYRSAMSFYRKPPISCHRGLATCISWILDFTTWVVLSISSSYSHKSKVSSNHPMPVIARLRRVGTVPVPPWETVRQASLLPSFSTNQASVSTSDSCYNQVSLLPQWCHALIYELFFMPCRGLWCQSKIVRAH